MNTDSPGGYKLSRGVNNSPVPMDNLRLEISPTCFYLLSYHHMEFAKFESTKDRDTLTISFLHHQARVAGRNLRELALGIQTRTVEFIKPVPGRYGAATENGFVESVEVEAGDTQEKSPD